MEPRSSLTFNTLGAWISGGSILIAQAAVWASTGAWPNWKFGDAWSLVGIAEPLTGADALRNLLHWVWAWPLGVAVFVCMAIASAIITPRRHW